MTPTAILRDLDHAAERAVATGLTVERLPGGRLAIGCPVCADGKQEVILKADHGVITGSCNRCNGTTIDFATMLLAEPGAADAQQPAPEHLFDVEPVLDHVGDLAGLLQRVYDVFTRYVVFAAPEQPIALTLWTAHTYTIAAFDTTPYISIQAVESQSGKSRTLDVAQYLAYQPQRSVRPSEFVIYRLIESFDPAAPTLLLDEIDTLFGKGEDEGIRGILDAGFQRGSTVARCVPPKMEVKHFPTFCPKAFAGIGRLPDTISNRSIIVRLKKKTKQEKVARFRRREVRERCEPIIRALLAWGESAVDDLAAARPSVPQEISDRAEEAWEPLIAIADMAGPSWGAAARQAAVVLQTGTPDDATEQSIGVRLLADVRVLVSAMGNADGNAPTGKLLQRLHELEEAPWGDWHGKPLTTRKLADLLRGYGVRSRQVRIGEQNVKCYPVADLEDAFERYLPPIGALNPLQPLQPPVYAENGGSQPATPTTLVAGHDTPETAWLGQCSECSDSIASHEHDGEGDAPGPGLFDVADGVIL